jgi:4-hydroxythreonine-4-phosphate dehydrogenase
MKTIVYTPGDPAGLGPELLCRLLSAGKCRPGPGQRLVIVATEPVLEQYCRLYGLAPFWTAVSHSGLLSDAPSGVYLLPPQRIKPDQVQPGEPGVEGGKAAGECLLAAVDMLLSGSADGLVTGPLNKAMLIRAGFDFPGHTEFLAEQSGLAPERVCMHLAGSELMVSLATTHVPLRKVPAMLTPERVLSCLRLTWEHIERLGLSGRPLAVCGLNPHAGEQGELGSEEAAIIQPAIRQACLEGVEAVGPLPADTVFHRTWGGEFSAALAMYHDQGLGPLKLLHFGQAVNVTLGLPFVRVSVDHGTGYDLVGTGRAGTASLERAFELAWKLV